MELFSLILLIIPFLYWNYKIIITDIQEEKIPNKYLLLLLSILPLWYIYAWYFWYYGEIHIWAIWMQLLLTLIICFLIFHFGAWGAWDAKYILILSLFIIHIWIVPYIFHLALWSTICLLGYFLWFWFWPNLWKKERRTNLFSSLHKMLTDSFSNYRKKNDKLYIKISLYILVFLILFIVIRFLRINVFLYIKDTYNISWADILSFFEYLYSLLICMNPVVNLSYDEVSHYQM